MDQDVADAITVIEKQMAEKDRKIAELDRSIRILSDKVGKMALSLQALAAALKGIGQ